MAFRQCRSASSHRWACKDDSSPCQTAASVGRLVDPLKDRQGQPGLGARASSSWPSTSERAELTEVTHYLARTSFNSWAI